MFVVVFSLVGIKTRPFLCFRTRLIMVVAEHNTRMMKETMHWKIIYKLDEMKKKSWLTLQI